MRRLRAPQANCVIPGLAQREPGTQEETERDCPWIPDRASRVRNDEGNSTEKKSCHAL
jgi:hypothetical protein